MTRSKTLSALLAATILAATAAPAVAVAIKHTSRVDGDPDLAAAPTGHAVPPADTTSSHPLDKLHETGAIR